MNKTCSQQFERDHCQLEPRYHTTVEEVPMYALDKLKSADERCAALGMKLKKETKLYIHDICVKCGTVYPIKK